ncbi:MAG: hypothetical protein K8I00_01275, partial [Candidatus Omnitrophica bacterium]|nr:hypothetical protein [Candidatus Omnitrophota bacterium]
MRNIKKIPALRGADGRQGQYGILLRVLLLGTLAVTTVYGIGVWKPSWVAEIGIWGVTKPYFACEETFRGADRYLSCRMHYLTEELRSKGQLKNDLWHGQALTYYRDGALRNKRQFDHGLRSGHSFTFRPDGSLAQKTEYHSDTEWTERQYYPTGELWAVYEYKETYPDGPQIRYGKSGRILSHTNAVQGQYFSLDGVPLNGVRRLYYENGALMSTYHYRNG